MKASGCKPVVCPGFVLVNAMSSAGRPTPHRYAMTGRTLRRVLDYIEENISRDLSLKEIAGVVGLSVSQCKYAFSKSVGLPIHQFVIQRRIERAKQLLAEDSLSISQVAEQAGFTHKSHLAFHIRRVYGMSPTGLRRQIGSS